jgi:hypothetical protein
MSASFHRLLWVILLVPSLLTVSAQAQRRRAVAPPIPDPRFTEGGYADRASVEAGSSIGFHIASRVSAFALRIVNLAEPEVLLATRGISAQVRNCNAGTSSGCSWDESTRFDVPLSWKSGYYAATFPTSTGDRSILFVVRPHTPGSWSKTVVISPTHTYQAYNDFGGKNLYPPNVETRATAVSYDRPYSTNDGLGRYPLWEKFFVDWMTETNRRFEVITDVDLENPSALAAYNVVVLPGHSEYWTAAGRARLTEFSARGGHIAALSGNNMWWQVRLTDDARTVVGFENAQSDPLLGIANELVTTNWYAHPVNQPENRVLGASFRNGGYANRVDAPAVYQMKPVDQRTPWRVADSGHWIFTGTGLHSGDAFGAEIAGLSVDGVVFNCDSNGAVIGPDGSDDAPRNYHILATVPASLGYGTMGFFVNPSGGAVFNAATQGWVWGLESDEVVQMMTANVLDRFATGSLFPYDAPQTNGVLAQDLFNCPASLLAQPGWSSNTARGTITPACAYEGPGGLEMSGNAVMAMARRVAPAGDSRDQLALRFYIKADDLPQRIENPIAIVALQDGAGRDLKQPAIIDIDATGGTRRIRIARRDSNNTFAGATDWVPLPNGWHRIDAKWKSPGAISLAVDQGTAVTLDNPVSGQRVSQMVVELPAPTLTSEGRVCIDAIAAGTESLPSVLGLTAFP